MIARKLLIALTIGVLGLTVPAARAQLLRGTSESEFEDDPSQESDHLVEQWRIEDVISFVEGDYAVIGLNELADDAASYGGWLRLAGTVTETGPAVIALRCIGEDHLTGIGRIESVTADRVPILVLNFSGAGGNTEIRFQIHGDLDNFALLSGPVRKNPGATRGWEHAVNVKSIPESCH